MVTHISRGNLHSRVPKPKGSFTQKGMRIHSRISWKYNTLTKGEERAYLIPGSFPGGWPYPREESTTANQLPQGWPAQFGSPAGLHLYPSQVWTMVIVINWGQTQDKGRLIGPRLWGGKKQAWGINLIFIRCLGKVRSLSGPCHCGCICHRWVYAISGMKGNLCSVGDTVPITHSNCVSVPCSEEQVDKNYVPRSGKWMKSCDAPWELRVLKNIQKLRTIFRQLLQKCNHAPYSKS